MAGRELDPSTRDELPISRCSNIGRGIQAVRVAMTCVETIIQLCAAAGEDVPAPLRWLAEWLPSAKRVTLGPDDLARIDAYRGGPHDLHQLVSTVLPLERPIWYETAITAQGGTEMVMGYGVLPAP